MENPELYIAYEFVTQTGRHVFLTGRAGTGKTTFLHNLKEQAVKRMVVTAPTGVAALNAGGMTLHSFFQLPFGIMLPGEKGRIFKSEAHKLGREKREIIRTLDLLVIDEISMVRADMLDAVDRVLRKYRETPQPFGGVQVLMIGDLYQLPPVVIREEQLLLKNMYETPYFFSSHVYRQAAPLLVELKHIYRQQDNRFIKLLNEVRDGYLSPRSARLLEQRYDPGYRPSQDDNRILLTTHNHKARQINDKRLNEIKAKSSVFQAVITGKFPEHAYPTDKELELKPGAQVMFVKNDSSYEKRYYNGKIGKIESIDGQKISVITEDGMPIDVKQETWERVIYTIDPETKEIKEEIAGTFSQIPLKPAWAITIHKSQGLTFDKVAIDAQDAFSHGQTYVALSRCRTLDGIVLTSPIDKDSIITDSRVVHFSEMSAHTPDEKEIFEEKKSYQLSLIREIFDFRIEWNHINRLLQFYFQHAGSITGELLSPLKELKEKVNPLVEVGSTFDRQLKQMTSRYLPADDPLIQERFRKACGYFLPLLNERLIPLVESITFDSDNNRVNQILGENILALSTAFHVKRALMEELSPTGFQVGKMLSVRAKAWLKQKKSRKKKKELTPKEHPGLFEELIMFRQVMANAENVHPNLVFQPESLYAMCKLLPVTVSQLRKIKGMGKTRVTKYGEEITAIIKEYVEKHGLTPDEKLLKKSAAKVGATHEATLQLVKDGLSVSEIARVRKLAPATIEGHLAQLLKTGKLRLDEVLPEDKITAMENAIGSKHVNTPLTQLREWTDGAFSFGELRMFMSWKMYNVSREKKNNTGN